MLSDGVTGKGAGEQVEVVDVATVLLRSVKPEQPQGDKEAAPIGG